MGAWLGSWPQTGQGGVAQKLSRESTYILYLIDRV